MDESLLVQYQKIYNNKAIFKYTKHSEHFRTEEYICTNEDGDMYLETIKIADNIPIENTITPLVKVVSTSK